jgi:hypothetical protein
VSLQKLKQRFGFQTGAYFQLPPDPDLGEWIWPSSAWLYGNSVGTCFG